MRSARSLTMNRASGATMTAAVPVLAAIGLLSSTSAAQAHRLDEYLQATRIGLSSDRIELTVELTPGSSIGSRILALIDEDGDGRVSDLEARGYAARVVQDLRLELNGRSCTLRVVRVDVPAAADLVDGMGTIHLDLEAVDLSLASGRSSLTFRNDHQPAASVYLVNTLKPSSPRIEVMGQERDRAQQGVCVTFDVSRNVIPAWSWPVVALLTLGAVRYRPSRMFR